MTTTIEADRHRLDWPTFQVYVDASLVALITMQPPEHIQRLRAPTPEDFSCWHIWMQPTAGDTWRSIINGSATYVGWRRSFAEAVRDVEYLVERQG